MCLYFSIKQPSVSGKRREEEGKEGRVSEYLCIDWTIYSTYKSLTDLIQKPENFVTNMYIISFFKNFIKQAKCQLCLS